MAKGSETREVILKAALDFSSKLGLESLSIGELAKKVGMSKSGLFGHFNSKEKLQMMVIDYAAQNFTDNVFIPAFKKERGIPRILAIAENWHKWSGKYFTGGCPFVAAAFEYDDRPGPVRDHIMGHQTTMLKSFEKAAKIAVLEGHFYTGLDCKSFAFEFYSFMLGYHLYSRLLKDEEAKVRHNDALESLILRSRKV
ncbi:MAG: TetR/AcrR family transcriptional regulator [Bacteriovoracaceae bacterium]|nr:TetR/AcrR family transcriptional regulator [Bacteriovoracaceae bacterium]